ncbi:hypothetical protein Ancab_017915 [Ancistrocladus abbreviatus]
MCMHKHASKKNDNNQGRFGSRNCRLHHRRSSSACCSCAWWRLRPPKGTRRQYWCLLWPQWGQPAFPEATVALYQKYGIGKMRLYEPNHDVLTTLQGKDFDLILGVKNQDIPTLASSESAADSWFMENVQPYV